MPDAVSPSHRGARLFAVLLALAWLSGCATRNVVSEGGDANLMLRGNDPVAYFTQNKAVKGDPKIKAQHEGLTYRFISQAHRETFARTPDRFVPAYGGFCASGAHYGLKSNIGADTFKVVDGRLFLFGGPRSLKHWELDEKANIALGDKYYRGVGVPKDVRKAVEFWLLSAKQGSLVAGMNAEGLYVNNEVIPENAAEKVKWYMFGAERGIGAAQLRLGEVYSSP